jgi:hypothetical protein
VVHKASQRFDDLFFNRQSLPKQHHTTKDWRLPVSIELPNKPCILTEKKHWDFNGEAGEPVLMVNYHEWRKLGAGDDYLLDPSMYVHLCSTCKLIYLYTFLGFKTKTKAVRQMMEIYQIGYSSARAGVEEWGKELRELLQARYDAAIATVQLAALQCRRIELEIGGTVPGVDGTIRHFDVKGLREGKVIVMVK